MTKEKLTYQEAIREIEEIIEKINSDEIEIDDLTEMVKRVSYLLSYCKDKLTKTEEEVEKVLDSIKM